ncbi:MlaD family protein [Paenalcaligenes sp. Me131]|uniref:MlaD family protein n=1 Tax=Paenalcaligenes sp. Me131 TaxID=3392636 RepID=UPI003D2E0500
MENKSHAMAAGVFVLVVAALLSLLAYWLTRDQGTYVDYELSSPQAVTGLQPQAAVRYKGVTVGRVASIGFNDEQPGLVIIHIKVEESTPISAKTYATLGYQGVTGLAYIELDDDAVAQPVLGTTESGYRRLEMRPSHLSRLVEMGPEFLGEIQETVMSLNTLLSKENQQVLMKSIAGMGEAAQNAADVMEGLKPVVATIAKDIETDMQVIRQAAGNLAKMGQDVSGIVQSMRAPGGVIPNLQQAAQSLSVVGSELGNATLPGLQRMMEEVSGAVQEVKVLIHQVSSNPQRFLYGPDSSQPGPGERGFRTPAAN